MRKTRVRSAGALLLAMLALSSCRNPEAQKLRHMEQGDKYAAEKRDDFAVVEYANAVKLDPKFGEARLKLAQTYERMGNLRAAAAEYLRAADALPENRDLQLRVTGLLLGSGRFDDAKARVEPLLARNPKDVEALLLHANALAALQGPADGIKQIEEALKVSPDSSAAFVNLGAMKMRTGEASQAEAAFRQAIALDPSSVNAKLALANFLWAAGRAPEAESTIKAILATAPEHLLANRMLGLLYVSTGRVKEAEQPLKMIADTSKSAGARFQLADYYVSAGRVQDAVSVLKELSSDPASFAEAELRLASLDHVEGRVPEAHKRLDGVLARVPNFAPGLVAKAQWLTMEKKLDEALVSARAAISADPQSAAAHFALGMVHDRRRETADAIKSYNEVLRLNPRAAAAQVELSRLSLTTGDATTALRFAEEATHAAPSSLEARVAVARSLVFTGDLPRAETEIAALLKVAPRVAAVHALQGIYHVRKNNHALARKAFERSLEMSPGYLEALGGLTYLDIVEKKPAQAVARLEPLTASQSPSAPLLTLLARAYSASGDHAKEEQTLRRAVTVDPRLIAGYTMLAQLYMRQNRLDEARAEFEGIGQRDPKATGARTMAGMLWEAQGKTDQAKKSYEATLRDDPNAGVAANNLAVIYAEAGENLDVALQLATTAKQRIPDEPTIDDTIGWIYYKKDLASLAVRPLEDSVKKMQTQNKSPGEQAEVLYHLGMTYAKLGDKAKARTTLESAFKMNPRVGGEAAQRALASVQ